MAIFPPFSQEMEVFLRQAAASCHRAPPAAPAPPSVTPSVSTSQQTRAAPVAGQQNFRKTRGMTWKRGVVQKCAIDWDRPSPISLQLLAIFVRYWGT